jgi:outer membrane protein TolC
VRKTIFAFCLFGLTATPAAAQLPEELRNDPLITEVIERVEVTDYDGRRVAKVWLEDILRLVAARSLTLEAAKLNTDIARRELRATQERYIDSLTTASQLDRSTGLSSDPTSVGNQIYAAGTSTDSLQLSSTFARRLRSGSSFGLTLAERRFQSRSLRRADEGGSLTAGDWSDWRDVTTARVFANIPLDKNAGTDFNNLPERFAELGVERSFAESRQTELIQLQTVASIFWDMVAVLENIEVQKSSVELSEQLLRDNQARLEVGTLSRTDVLVSETQLSRDRQALFAARLDALRIEDQLRAALDLSELEIGFYPQNRPSVRPLELDRLQLLQQVEANDPQLDLLTIALQSNRLETEQEENNERNDLDLDLSYTLSGYANQPLVGATDFTETDLHGFNATLTWTLPLGDRATPERLQQKRLQREQLLLNRDSRLSELDVTLQTVIRSLQLAEQEVETAQTVVSLASEQLQNELERFRLGQGTSFQVSQFQQQESQAKAQEIIARVNFEKAYLELLTLTGEIYATYNLPTPQNQD